MRVRDLQQILGKFTDGEKGTNISDCPIYIETKDGYMEEVRFIALEKNKIIGSPEPARIVLNTKTYKGLDHELIQDLKRTMVFNESIMDNAQQGANRETGRHFG